MSEIPLSPLGKRSSLLALGFRPFFLAAAALALLAMAIWLARLWGLLPGDTYLGGTAWHAHEMLFGYVGAVIAGFLLTAARNWTGIDTPTGGVSAPWSCSGWRRGSDPCCNCPPP